MIKRNIKNKLKGHKAGYKIKQVFLFFKENINKPIIFYIYKQFALLICQKLNSTIYIIYAYV